MNRTLGPILIGVGALLLLAFNTFFIVPQSQQAIVLRVGEFTRAINAGTANEPGLKFKIPFVDSVVMFDKRNLGLTLEGQSIVAADQERLIVDAIVRWRIVNPRLFYQAALNEEGGAQRLRTFTEAAMRRALGSANSADIISGRRAELMQAIENDLNREAAVELGVTVADVRIRQADLPPETAERVFQRMRTEREQVAARIRAEGEEAATRIRADADRQTVILEAEAREQSERLRGQGDGDRARIFARAYGRDAEFAAFYRSMRAYETALPAGTPMVVTPDSDFFRYMRDSNGR